MKRMLTVCFSLAGLATLVLPSTSEAFGRRNRGGDCCGSTAYVAPASDCCGGGVASNGCSSCGGTAYAGSGAVYASGGSCSSCGTTASNGTQGVYTAQSGTVQTGAWQGGACSNCGPTTVYGGQAVQPGMAIQGQQTNVQQAGYQTTNGAGTIVLTVPENAEVMWGGQPVYGSGTTRRFVTLPIQGNNGAEQFQIRYPGTNGQWVTRSQSINATAGQTVNYNFVDQNANAATGTQGQFGTEEAQPQQGTNPNDPNSPRRLPNPNQNNQNNQNQNPNKQGTQGNTTDIQGGVRNTQPGTQSGTNNQGGNNNSNLTPRNNNQNNNTNPGASGTTNNNTNPGNTNDNSKNRKNRDDDDSPPTPR